MPTTASGVPYPAPGAPPNIPADMYDLAAWIEAHLPRSGLSTPDTYHITNVGGSGNATERWVRIGDVVSVTGHLQVTATANGRVVIGLELPVGSNLWNSTMLAGLAVVQVGGTALELAGYMSADFANDRVTISYLDAAGGGVTRDISYHYSYEVYH